MTDIGPIKNEFCKILFNTSSQNAQFFLVKKTNLKNSS